MKNIRSIFAILIVFSWIFCSYKGITTYGQSPESKMLRTTLELAISILLLMIFFSKEAKERRRQMREENKNKKQNKEL